jgi:hypothetical protein
MDRVMSTALNLQPELLDLLSTASLTIAIKQADGPARVRQLPPDEELEVGDNGSASVGDVCDDCFVAQKERGMIQEVGSMRGKPLALLFAAGRHRAATCCN